MKKNKKQHILLYFLKMLLIFVVIDLLMMIFAALVTNSSIGYKYGSDLIMELFYGLFILIVMLLFKNSYVFTSKKDKFIVGIKLAIPMLVISFINLFSSILSLDSFSLVKFINVLILSIFVGVAEEFLCRGWLQNEFLERYSDNKNSVIISIVLSSLVFGAMHIMNLGAQTLFETILQIINAVALGLLLGSVYYKTKNIWSVIALHAFYDFAIFLGEMNLVKDCTYNTPTLGITIVSSVGILIVSIIWVLSAILVLRKTDFPNKKANPKVNNSSIVTTIVIAFVLLFVPFENLVPEYKDYQVCYEYNKIDSFKNYAVHYPYYDKYIIEDDIKSYVDDEKGNKYEVIDDKKYLFEVSKKNGKAIIKNLNTETSITLSFNEVVDVEVLENDDKYVIVVQTYENESTIYYSEYFIKNEMSNEFYYLNGVNSSFKKYELPEISSLGYVTLDDSNTKYPFMVSINSDYFVIKNGELYLVD